MLNRLSIGTKIGAAFAAGLAVFGAIGFVAFKGTNQLVDTSRKEAHTYQVLGGLEEILALLRDAETGQRGFLLTRESRYLEPYNNSVDKVKQRMRDLRELIKDNPEQQRNLDSLEPLVDGKLAELKETLDLERTQSVEAALAVVRTNRGKQLMDSIRTTIQRMESRERELLQQRSGAAELAARDTIASIGFGTPLGILILAVLGVLLNRHIAKPLTGVSQAAEKVSDGDMSVRVPESDRQDEVGILGRAFNHMIRTLQLTTTEAEAQAWLKSNLAEFGQIVQGQRDLETVSRLMLSNLAPLVGAQQGVFYLLEDGETPILKLVSSYAYQERKQLSNQFRLGEGLVGQCALEKQRILLTDVPSDYIRIRSGLGDAPPLNLLVLPLLFENQVVAIIELASFQRFSDIHLALLDQLGANFGIVLNTIAADMRTRQLLVEAQTLAEELQHQQEELQLSNQRLQEQTATLEASQLQQQQQQEELRQSNEELQQLNEELEEKSELLAVQKREVEHKNQEIEQAQVALQEKAEQLALSSKYKSEFLANMSHELRTPLNSLLILAKILSDNGDRNLTQKQVEYSQTIYAAGNDLLTLINDILDLAKIESGTIALEIESLRFRDLKMDLDRTFAQLAQNKGLNFTIDLDPNLPEAISTDSKRLQQVLKNLLANAFKFTDQGSVTLSISPTSDQAMVAFAVTDTGIGISPEKQELIFEAFQQADGTTSRKYGGTGLGLSISRELAQRLGGYIRLSSERSQGSTFTLYLPEVLHATEAESPTPRRSEIKVSKIEAPERKPIALSPQPQMPISIPSEVSDDRDSIQTGDLPGQISRRDRVLLVIEDDIKFVQILIDMARSQGFKVLVATRSQAGLALAQQFKPQAILLDIYLPDVDGWTVLDRLKRDPELRHIPVHILSSDDQRQRGLQAGAIAYLQKPVSPESLGGLFSNIKGFIDRPVRNLLIIEDDTVQAQSIVELIGGVDVHTTSVSTGAAALEALQQQQVDCVVMDLGLPDMSGFDLIEQIKQTPELMNVPIVVYTGKELTRSQETQLKRLAETIIIKDVRSPERLLDETALFLHRIQANLPQPKRQMIEELRQADTVLANKKILIVDDDVRNIFALTSLLERYQMQVLYAENGREGIEMLKANSDINIVLMDIMMPEMDGYETTQAIRQQPEFKSLPIIALTAKAMQGDREKCIEAGTSDYITKPVDTEQLLSLLRVWLYQ